MVEIQRSPNEPLSDFLDRFEATVEKMKWETKASLEEVLEPKGAGLAKVRIRLEVRAEIIVGSVPKELLVDRNADR